jgi:hypothetical protein
MHRSIIRLAFASSIALAFACDKGTDTKKTEETKTKTETKADGSKTETKTETKTEEKKEEKKEGGW